MTARDFLGKLANVKRVGGGWTARCPAHDDANSSLSISEGDDGRVLLHCHAGCTAEQIVRSRGCELRDLFPAGSRNGHKRGEGVLSPPAPVQPCNPSPTAPSNGTRQPRNCP